jgi:exopolysaccharide production protein ExoZ
LNPFGFWPPTIAGAGLLALAQYAESTAYAPALFLLLVGLVNIRAHKAAVAEKVGVLLGDASYSIYLIHPLVFSFVYALLQPPLPPLWTQEFLRFGSIAIVCILAIASWKLFESPMIRLGSAIAKLSAAKPKEAPRSSFAG